MTCPRWCRSHLAVCGDPGVFTHLYEVGSVQMPARGDLTVWIAFGDGIDASGMPNQDAPAVVLSWPGGDDGRELPADPATLSAVARLLETASEALSA